MSAFERLFDPRGIAIVGASGDVTRFGGQTVRALNQSGFAGGVYPVNPKYPEIDGRRCYPQIGAIDGPCDLAVIALPAALVPDAIRQCGEQGIGFAVVLGGGFREMGEQGARQEEQMLAAARQGGVRIIGPNCIGMVSVHKGVIAAFGSMTRPPRLQPGPVSVAVQSGGFGMSVVIQCAVAGVGFRHVVASGSESDITMPELLNAYVDDPGTRVIFAYVEGVKDGRAFIEALERARRADKPVLIWKGGKTGQGAKAAASHTANLTSTYNVYQAAFRQCGAIEIRDTEQAVDLLLGFTAGRLPRGRNVAVVTNTGGSAVVFSDAADQSGLTLTPLTSRTTGILKASLPPLASIANPVDTTAGYPRPEHGPAFRTAFEALLDDPEVHQLCVLFGTIMGNSFELGTRVLSEAAMASDKPVFVFSAVPREISTQGLQHLQAARIPVLPTPDRAARVMGMLAAHAERVARGGNAVQVPLLAADDMPQLPHVLGVLDEHTSKRLLAGAGISVTRDVLLPLEPAGFDLSTLPFPVALKLVSRDVPHKSDVGGVELNIANAGELVQAARRIVARVREAVPGAQLEGLLACPMVSDGLETIIGVVNDPSFGPVVAFGLGGVLAETLNDVTYRIAPFGPDEARAMVDELRGVAVFSGLRGRAAVDMDALVTTLVRVSLLAWAWREQLTELDINPLLVRPRGLGVVAADALLVLR